MRRLLPLLALVACDDDTTAVEVDAAPPGGAVCAFDDSTDPASAARLSLGEEVEGFLCPVGDVDWYSLRAGPEARILEIELGKGSPLSPVAPTYGVWIRDGDTTGELVASPRPDEVGGERVTVSHCVPEAELLLAVRDLGEANEDRRHPYSLTVRGRPDPDPSEPNDDRAEATALAAATPVVGAVGCRGDEDWYAVEIGEREVLSWRLEVPVAGFHPRVRVLSPDGVLLDDQRNPAGVREATDLQRVVGTRAAGVYNVVVSDDDGSEADPAVTYTLTVDVAEEIDPNEPNDVPADATELAAVRCGDEWTGWIERQGTVGTLGDPDWFRLPTEACRLGLVEVEVTLDGAGLSDAEAWALQRELQMSVAFVFSHPDSPCEQDTECRLLNRPCANSWDCRGLFNTCLPEGTCAGATTCLPGGECGAFRVERHYERLEVGEGAPPPNAVVLSAPAVPRDIYLRVGDFGGDALAPDRLYTVRVRVRADPDTNEPNNIYTPTIRRSDPVGVHLNLAREMHVVPVHACEGATKGGQDAGPDAAVDLDAAVDAAPPEPDAAPLEPDAAPFEPDAAPPEPDAAAPEPDAEPPEPDAAQQDPDAAAPEPDGRVPEPDATVSDAAPDAAVVPGPVPGCCGPDDWVEGAISYEADQDFFAYAHPCPGEDCMVRILFEVDGGGVDPLWQVFRGDALWYDGIVPIAEGPDQPPRSGAFGGLGPDDQCFYAFHGHEGEPFYYAIGIRDLLPGRDWDPDQRYRFCIEKVADGCEAPCELHEDGCGLPSE